FILQRYFQAPAVDFQQVLESNLELGERLKPLVADVTGILEQVCVDGGNALFEGAQGAMLDVDLGTYPYVTSSTTTAGGAAAGTGLGPRRLHEVLGIVKAYATRVGAGPFPTELFDQFGEHLSRVGHEFGSVTGRRRRCGWFDAVAMRRSIVHNSCSLLCVTKLDVLDGLDVIRVCVGYKIGERTLSTPPLLSEHFGDAQAVYEELPGWTESTVGITRYEDLPANARSYLERLQVLVGVPITIISTGPDRDQTIIRQNPFG
ncbi:MAG TPA: adenylosuccinate synthetase, partial [Steroidobacteraceae bacterium]|nr:adenylosuccinate synthetase [Steroidobacteraceae bacterium]